MNKENFYLGILVLFSIAVMIYFIYTTVQLVSLFQIQMQPSEFYILGEI